MMRVITVAIASLLSLAAPMRSAQATSHGPKRHGVDHVIIHTIGGPTCENGKVVYTDASGDALLWKGYFENHEFLSIHYIIDRHGVTVASVPEDETANHALGRNEGSIGIELVHNGDGQEEFGHDQIDAVVVLLKKIRERHSIPIGHIVGHADIDDRTFLCGGQEMKSKPDPGANFPWAIVRTALQSSE